MMSKQYLLYFIFITASCFTSLSQAKKNERNACEQVLVNSEDFIKKSRDKQILNLAIRFEELLKQTGTYTEEAQSLIHHI